MSVKLIALLAMAPVAIACGDEEDPNGGAAACEPSAPPEVLTEEEGAVRGSIVVLDRRDFTRDDAGNPRADVQGRVQATFADFSSVTSTPSALMPLGDTCVGIISRPAQSGDLVRLDLESLSVMGTSGGDLSPMRTGMGVYSSVQPRLLLDGAASIRAIGTAMAGGFPSFDETLEGIEPLIVEAPASDGRALLSPGDLEVRWKPGNGQYVQIRIIPKDDTATGGQVACISTDDGCFVVPAAASIFLLAGQEQEYVLSVERRRVRSVRLEAETTLDVDLVAEQRLSLLNGELE